MKGPFVVHQVYEVTQLRELLVEIHARQNEILPVIEGFALGELIVIEAVRTPSRKAPEGQPPT